MGWLTPSNPLRYEEVTGLLEDTCPRTTTLFPTRNRGIIPSIPDYAMETLVRNDIHPPFALLKEKSEGGKLTNVSHTKECFLHIKSSQELNKDTYRIIR